MNKTDESFYQEAIKGECEEWKKINNYRLKLSKGGIPPELDVERAPKGLYDVPWATTLHWRKYYHDSNDSYIGINNYNNLFINVIFKQQNISQDALEIGCGLGSTSVRLARLGFNVKAFDLSNETIEIAKGYAHKEKLNIEYSTGDANNIDTYNNFGKFSTIIIHHTFHHIFKPDFVLSRLRDHHLLPGGKIFIIDSGMAQPRFIVLLLSALELLMPTISTYRQKMTVVRKNGRYLGKIVNIFFRILPQLEEKEIINELNFKAQNFPISPFENCIRPEKFMPICQKYFSDAKIISFACISSQIIPILERNNLLFGVCKSILNILDKFLLKIRVTPCSFGIILTNN